MGRGGSYRGNRQLYNVFALSYRSNAIELKRARTVEAYFYYAKRVRYRICRIDRRRYSHSRSVVVVGLLRKVTEPYVVVLNSLPKIALGPVIIIWVGAGAKAIIMMTVLICIVVTILTSLGGMMETDAGKILLMRSMGATKRQILTMVVFPSALPTLLGVLKINVGLAWVGTIMGEYLVSGAGLGYLIIYGGQVFKLDLVMTSTVILCLLAGIMYFVVAAVEKIAIRNRCG